MLYVGFNRTFLAEYSIDGTDTYSDSFAQWRYSNQWSNREVLLLLVENYTQYPANSMWNTIVYGNFWRLPRKQIIVSVSSFPDHAPGKVQAAPPSRPCPRKRRKARNSIPPGGPRCRDFSWWLVGWCEISHPDWPNNTRGSNKFAHQMFRLICTPIKKALHNH